MFEKDGGIYAGEPAAGLRVIDARVTNELSMLVTFSTGEQRVFDAAPLLGIPAFAALSDPAAFEAFAINHGILTWCGGDIDIAPETLYSQSFGYRQSA